MIVNVLILMSQFANVLLGGDPDEMLCSRAWRLRGKSQFWFDVVTFIDYYTPLASWRGDYDSHCEACYHEERKRIAKRVMDYDSTK